MLKTCREQKLLAFCVIFRLFSQNLVAMCFHKVEILEFLNSNLTKIVIWFEIWAKMICDFNQSINQSTGLLVWQLKAGLKHAGCDLRFDL